jgi:hypothetical protein
MLSERRRRKRALNANDGTAHHREVTLPLLGKTNKNLKNLR